LRSPFARGAKGLRRGCVPVGTVDLDEPSMPELRLDLPACQLTRTEPAADGMYRESEG